MRYIENKTIQLNMLTYHNWKGYWSVNDNVRSGGYSLLIRVLLGKVNSVLV